MRVLVTGGPGYIGSHTDRALRRAEFEPVMFDDLSTATGRRCAENHPERLARPARGENWVRAAGDTTFRTLWSRAG